MRKGHIVLVPFPFTDLSANKVRPALILHTDAQDYIVAFISSLPERKLTFDVLIKATAQNGLKINSRIKINKLATLHKGVVLGKLGFADAHTMLKVNAILKKMFALK